jgi:O-antigen/teichoic acid export membrane protein
MDRSFLKHAAVYGLANLLVQAAGFILLPIYLRCLDLAGYGVLELVGRLAETVGTFLLFGGFRQALLTFYQQAPDEPGRRQVVSATYVLVLGSCLLGGTAALLLSPALGTWLTPNVRAQGATLSSELVRLAVLGILLEPLTLIPLALLQARVQSIAYVGVVVAQFLVRVGLSILLVCVLGWGVTGALSATALTGALFGLVLSGRELIRSTAWPRLAQVRALAVFALPLLPGGLCFFLLHHGDRFFLAYWCGPAEVGRYALGYKLALVVSVFSLSPLYMVWSSRLYAAACRPDAPIVFGQVFTRILAAYLFVGLGMCLFAPEAVAVLGGERCAGAVWYVAPVVLACFCQSASSLMDAGLYVRRRTGLKLGVTLATTAVMLALYALLIPPWGGKGAALATLGGFAFLAGATFVVSQRVFPVHYHWLRLAGMVGLACGLWLAGQALPEGGWSLPGRIALWLLAPVLAWLARWAITPPPNLLPETERGSELVLPSPSASGGEGLGVRGVSEEPEVPVRRRRQPQAAPLPRADLLSGGSRG